MKTKTVALICGGVGLMNQAFGQGFETAPPVLVKAPIERVFVPVGFDDNDNAEIIIYGHFKNSCFKVGPATTKVDASQNLITVTARSWRYGEATCTDMQVPFTQSLKLGALKKGHYQIVVSHNSSLSISPLEIVAAPSAQADDFLYAPVEQVEISKNAVSGYDLRLSGTFPRAAGQCMRITDVKTAVVGQDVLIVQPASEVIASADPCESVASRQFVKTVHVGALPRGELLIHVRVLNGESLNRVVEIE